MTPSEAPELELAPEPAGMSEPARLLGVFFTPKKAFADIARRPRWWAPILLTSLVVTGYLYLYSQHIGWESFIRQQLSQSTQTNNMPPEQRAQVLRIYRTFGPAISIAAGLIQPILMALIVAGVIKFLADVILGAGIGFKKVLASVTYGSLPSTLLGTILACIVMMSVDPGDFDLQNPLMFHAGAFLSQDAPRWLKVGASSLDLFTFWTMILISMGLSAGSRKMSTGKAFGMLLFPWALIVIIRVGVAAAFG
jgi:hypothetical protein